MQFYTDLTMINIQLCIQQDLQTQRGQQHNRVVSHQSQQSNNNTNKSHITQTLLTSDHFHVSKNTMLCKNMMLP